MEELSVFTESELAIQEQVCYFFADPMDYPNFPGGNKAAVEFIKANVIVPPLCFEGKVYVSFVVEEDGAISNIEVLKGISKEHDAEAIRLVSLFPKWEPGKQYGIPVRTKMLIPIAFNI